LIVWIKDLQKVKIARVCRIFFSNKVSRFMIYEKIIFAKSQKAKENNERNQREGSPKKVKLIINSQKEDT
jgi:hypothetical protein